MNEVKKPKKPLIYYYLIVALILILFNSLIMPKILAGRIKKVDYNTFIDMTEKQEIGEVQIKEQDNYIVFTDKDEKNIYKTAMVNDQDLTERLYKAGVSFSGEEIEQMSPLLSFFLSWIVPILLFTLIGQLMYRQMMKRAGGGKNAMTFGMGKSNAKVYVKSSNGIKFDDVAGEDEAKENLAEIVDYLHNPDR